VEKILVQSEVDKLQRSIMLLGFILFGSLSLWITKPIIATIPLQIPVIILALVFWGFTLWSLIGFWIYFAHLKVYSDKLTISNWGGFYRRIILFTDIISIKTAKISHKNVSTEECVIKTIDNKQYKIYETSYDNYSDIKKALPRKILKNVPRNKLNKNREKTIEKAFLIGSVLLFLYGIYSFYYESVNYIIDKDSLVEVAFTLEKKPTISKGKNPHLALPIKEFPNFDFHVSGAFYKASEKVVFVKNTEGGEIIYLTLNKEEYEQKLTHQSTLTFWNEHFNFFNVKIYGARTDKLVCLTTNTYINAQRQDSKIAFCLIIGILLLFLYTLRKEIKRLI
jgi:hypothetical protein